MCQKFALCAHTIVDKYQLNGVFCKIFLKLCAHTEKSL